MSHPQILYYSPVLPLVPVNGTPHGLIAKTKNNQSQGQEAIHSCLMPRYRWEGRCLRLKTSTFKPCHIIRQLGSALDNVDGGQVVFLEPSFRLSWSQVGGGHKPLGNLFIRFINKALSDFKIPLHLVSCTHDNPFAHIVINIHACGLQIKIQWSVLTNADTASSDCFDSCYLENISNPQVSQVHEVVQCNTGNLFIQRSKEIILLSIRTSIPTANYLHHMTSFYDRTYKNWRVFNSSSW